MQRQAFEVQDDPFGADAPLPSFPMSERGLDDYEEEVHEVSSVEDFEPPTAAAGVATVATEGLRTCSTRPIFFATRGLYEDAKAILIEQLGRTPNHPLVLERLREVDYCARFVCWQPDHRALAAEQEPSRRTTLDFDVAQSLGARR
ncbi:MAG: hypothetical protein WDO74_30325 [Pseudomonadota bacterium]